MNMFRSIAIIVLSATASCITPAGHAAHAGAPSPDASVVNRGVVELETGRAADISVRMAEEIAGIIDDGATRRVVPVVGKGPLQNLTDLKYLRGVDLAIVPADALDYAREQRLFPGIETSLTYITKLYNEEFHLLVRPDIKKLADLSNQTVNVDVQGSSTGLTANRLFGLLNLKVKIATDDPEVALQKLRKGEIAALAFVAAKPAPFFLRLKAGAGLHLLSIPLNQAVTAAYAPTQITATDYPDLVAAGQPADTVAVGSVLMAADLRMLPERSRNIANFVEALFTGFPALLKPGHEEKWQEVNLGADVPGWARHAAAAQWLQRNAPMAAAPSPDAMKALFARFVDERRQAIGGVPLSAVDKDALFQQFQAWQHGQAR
jgi:uncharacterized protein